MRYFVKTRPKLLTAWLICLVAALVDASISSGRSNMLGSKGVIGMRTQNDNRRGQAQRNVFGDQLCSLNLKENGDDNQVLLCGNPSVAKTLFRGAALRIASDISGGTVFESIKTRVSTTKESPWEATRNIVNNGGILSLWTGTQSRIVEGALVGAVFMWSSRITKAQIVGMGAGPEVAALVGGLVGGVAQAIVMTPAGMVFTSLNCNKEKKGFEKDNAMSVTRRIVKEKGVRGMFYGGGPMALRQASNWASRAGLTEIARTSLGLSQMGIVGEIGSGILGGLGSCWNTPIEFARMRTQRDVSSGKNSKSMLGYWTETINEEGWTGVYRGITPRAMQAIWQTCFLVVVPNVMGL
ncbi:hypothetical protein MPSEU_000664500 [Mayamaea pseudoterrestris]|nr:hypothetical protein MPSEU_000664500 [Mayamaea pseudoterrestris]